MAFLSGLLPSALKSGRYDRYHFLGDVIAAVIVAIMLIPQSLSLRITCGYAGRGWSLRQHITADRLRYTWQ